MKMVSELSQVFTSVDSRDRLLEAALAAFSESGYHGATIRDISKRANVSQGLITHHFKDKETLWNMVGERVSEDFLTYLLPIIEQITMDSDTIPRLLHAYMDYWREHPKAFRHLLWRLLGSPEEERTRRVQKINKIIIPIFQKAQKLGFLRNDIAASECMIIAGAMIQYRLHSKLELENALIIDNRNICDDNTYVYMIYKCLSPTR